MRKLRVVLAAGALMLGACSSGGGKDTGLLAAAGAGAPAAATAGSTATAGTTGGSSSPAGRGPMPAGQGAAGSEIAGAGAAGRGAAGSSAPIAGTGAGNTGGAGVAGTGAAGASMAGSGAAGGGGTGGATAGAGGAAGGGGATGGSVLVQFKTVSYGGEYAPLNYGAVWFERGAGGFLKTAKRWAGAAHATDLVTWTMASGGWGSLFGGGGNTADMMDAISSATLRTHQTHMVMWSMKDAQKQAVPDGDYVAVIEMSESRARDQAGPVLRIKFTKGPMAQTVMPADEKSFTGISLRYTP